MTEDTKQIIVRPEAEADIGDAYKWYESQRKGLGESFLLCIEESLARISRKPSIYRLVHENVRRILIHRFPFGIFFVEEDDRVVIIAVLHARRNPKAWKKRT